MSPAGFRYAMPVAARKVQLAVKSASISRQKEAGHDVFRVVASACCFMEVYGDEGNDQIVAQGPASLFGGPGNDRLSNTSPNDHVRIYGGAGNDVCDRPAQSFFFARVRGCEVTSGNVLPELPE